MNLFIMMIKNDFFKVLQLLKLLFFYFSLEGYLFININVINKDSIRLFDSYGSDNIKFFFIRTRKNFYLNVYKINNQKYSVEYYIND